MRPSERNTRVTAAAFWCMPGPRLPGAMPHQAASNRLWRGSKTLLHVAEKTSNNFVEDPDDGAPGLR